MPDQEYEQCLAKELFKRLKFTVNVVCPDERPDLVFRLEGKIIGMEITQSIPSERHRGDSIARKLASKSSQPIPYCTSNLFNHGRKRSNDELCEDMYIEPTYVNRADQRQRWCEEVRSQWGKKRKKLNEPTYSRFDENWLLIADRAGLPGDSSTFENIQEEVSRTKFLGDEGEEFEHVYIISGDHYTFHCNHLNPEESTIIYKEQTVKALFR